MMLPISASFACGSQYLLSFGFMFFVQHPKIPVRHAAAAAAAAAAALRKRCCWVTERRGRGRRWPDWPCVMAAVLLWIG